MRLWWKFCLKLRSETNFKFGHDLNFTGNFETLVCWSNFIFNARSVICIKRQIYDICFKPHGFKTLLSSPLKINSRSQILD